MSAARAWRSAAEFLAAPRMPKLRGPDIINLVGLLTLVLFTALSSTRSGVQDDLGGECDVADEGEEWANAVSASTTGGVDGRFWTGVALSVVADAAIAISLNVQKLAHNRNHGPDGKPIKPYVQVPMWWAGMILNILGEAGNGLAYGFAPAVVVAPVGSVGVFFNELIAVIFLKEKFRLRDAGGLVAVVAGVCMIIVGAMPERQPMLTAETLLSNQFYAAPRSCAAPRPRLPAAPGAFTRWPLLACRYLYHLFLIFAIISILLYFEPKFAENYIVVWLLMCSLVASVTVGASRGFFAMLACVAPPPPAHHHHHAPARVHTSRHALRRAQTPTPRAAAPRNIFDSTGDCALPSCVDGYITPPCMQTVGSWLFWLLFIVIVVTAIWSAMYLQKAMMLFGNTEVVPVYYCTFTLLSIIGGAVVYNEFASVKPLGFALFAVGVVVAISGVLMICSGRRGAELADAPAAHKLDALEGGAVGGAAGVAASRNGSGDGGGSARILSAQRQIGGVGALAAFFMQDMLAANREAACRVRAMPPIAQLRAQPISNSARRVAGVRGGELDASRGDALPRRRTGGAPAHERRHRAPPPSLRQHVRAPAATSPAADAPRARQFGAAQSESRARRRRRRWRAEGGDRQRWGASTYHNGREAPGPARVLTSRRPRYEYVYYNQVIK